MFEMRWEGESQIQPKMFQIPEVKVIQGRRKTSFFLSAPNFEYGTLKLALLSKVWFAYFASFNLSPFEVRQMQWFGEKEWINLDDVRTEFFHFKEV